MVLFTKLARFTVYVILFMTFVFPILMVGYSFIMTEYGKRYYESLSENKRVYCYSDFHDSVVNPCYYIENLKDKDKLISYYDSLFIKRDTTPIINFPIKMMPVKKKLISLGWAESDSNLLKVVDFNKECWGYVIGYVDKRTIHKNPPKKHEYNIDHLPKQDPDKISEYGIYCD